MNSAQFQGSAKSTPFAPLKALDQTDAMRQQLNDQVRWMREDQQMVIDDRRQFAAALDRKMRDQSAFREQDLQALAGMSKNLTDTLLQIKKDRDQDAQEEGLALFYQYGLPLDQVDRFEKDEQTLAEARDKTNEYADRVARSGAPPEVVEQIRNLSGWKRYGYMIGLAQDAGLKWGEFLDNALAKDDQTQVDLGNGRIITPSQAQDKAEMAAVAQVLRKKFMRDAGLTGANPALLNKYLFPNMRQGEDPVIGKRYLGIVTAKAQETIDEQLGVFTTALQSGSAGEGFNALVSTLRSVIDPKTRTPLGPGGARDMGIEMIRKLASDGTIDTTVIDQIEQSNIPGSTTETWGGKFPQLFIGLRDAIREGKEADLAAQEREEARAEKEREEQIIALGAQKGGFTDAEIQMIRQEYELAGRPLPNSIANLITVDQRNEQQAEEYLDSLLASGRGITEQDLMNGGYSNTIINKYRPRVREFETNISNNPAFKAGIKALDQRLLNLTLDRTSQGARPHWTLELAKAKAAELLRVETMKNVQAGMDPAQAAAAAVIAVEKLIADGQPKNGGPGVGPFRVATDKTNPGVAAVNGGFVGLLTGVRAKAQEQEAQFRRLYDQVQANKAGGRFLDMPLLTPEDLQQLDRLRRDPTLSFPASILYLSQQSRTNSPWDVAERQWRASGKTEPFTKPPEVQWSDGIDQRLRQLLNFAPSFNRTQRAYTGTPWNINKVPNGWGAAIEKAARANGLDPALLAGLLQTENQRWDPRAVSRAGAVGLGQIRADTIGDAGMSSLNDRLDPIKSINGAARVLATRLRAVGGDLTLALRAYNMGLGGATRNPGGYPGDRESIEYPGKVLRAAAAFGYGFGAGSPFRQQESLNPRIGGLSPAQMRLANTDKLVPMKPGYCTTAVLETLQANGIPNPSNTGKDPGNNPRGLAAQLVRGFGWKPLPGLGRPETIVSPYGRFQVNMMTNEEYQLAIQAGRIPSGALSFATRHSSWNNNSPGSSGFDVAIVRNRGRNHFNGPMLGSEIYPGQQRLVFVLVHPKDGRRS